MPDFDFTIDTSALIASGLRVLLILLAALISRFGVRRMIKRLVAARIPKVRQESIDQLALRSDTVSHSLSQAASFFIWTIAFVIVLSELGVDIGPLLASLGVASLAIGFAAQSLIRDYLHGVFIVLEDWYRIGEVAIINGEGGLVEEITFRRTVLRNLDGTRIMIPNSQVGVAKNMTRDWSRINLNVSVAYGTDLNAAFAIINEVGQQMKADPQWGVDLITAPKAERVDLLGASGIEIKILADTQPIKQWGLAGELRRRLKERFDAEGIEIPWPHTKVFFGNEPIARDN